MARDIKRDMKEEQRWEWVEVGVGHGGLMGNQDRGDRRREEGEEPEMKHRKMKIKPF